MAKPAIENPQAAKKTCIILRVTGGELPAGTFSQKVGPLGLNSKKLGETIKNITTADYRAQKVHVKVEVEGRDAQCILNPSTAQLVIRELRENRELRKKGGDKNPRPHNGNLRLSSLFKILGEIKDRSRAKSLKNTCKEILGTCLSVGCTVEGKSPKEIIVALNKGRMELAKLCGIEDDIDMLPAFLDE